LSSALQVLSGYTTLLVRPLNLPIAASGSRAPDKQRPRPVPKQIKAVIKLMIYGEPNDPDGKPVDFITAAKACGVRPDIMRKWLDRPEVRSFLRAERRAYREIICSGNEGALRRIRDESANAMAQINAVRTLEQICEEETIREGRGTVSPGLVICMVQERPPQPSPAPVVDVEPLPVAEPAPPDPIFRSPLTRR
jgi:hypothetical protein